MSTKSKSIAGKTDFNQDERLKKVSNLKILLNRPELGALGGAILVFIFFGIVAGDTGMFSAYGILNFLDVMRMQIENTEILQSAIQLKPAVFSSILKANEVIL